MNWYLVGGVGLGIVLVAVMAKRTAGAAVDAVTPTSTDNLAYRAAGGVVTSIVRPHLDGSGAVNAAVLADGRVSLGEGIALGVNKFKGALGEWLDQP